MLVNKLNLKYQCPTRHPFSEVKLPRLYSYVRDSKVKPKFGDAAYCSLTLDLWTSTSHDPYLSVTIDFIDNEWCLKTFCLETTPLYDDHAGTNIKDAVVEILQNWDIKIHGSESRGQEEAGLRNERVSNLQVVLL